VITAEQVAKRLITVAAAAGCDYAKFQKRSPDDCVPEAQKHTLRATPWGPPASAFRFSTHPQRLHSSFKFQATAHLVVMHGARHLLSSAASGVESKHRGAET
jgi:sialic acid synthase SpsE